MLSESRSTYECLYRVKRKKMDDIWSHVTTHLDDVTLQKLYLVPLDLNLEACSRSQLWWFERVRVLTLSKIAFSALYCWKQAYIILKRCLANPSLRMDNIQGPEEDNPLVIEALLAMGLPSPGCMPSDCVRIGLPRILKMSLDDLRITVEKNDMIPFIRAINLRRDDMLAMLLSHERTIDNSFTFYHLVLESSRAGNENALKILLADERSKDYPANRALRIALKNGYVAIAKLILSDKRMNISKNRDRILHSITDDRRRDGAIILIQQLPKLARVIKEDPEVNESWKTYLKLDK